ncbi:hypothetical protein [Cerasicoccus frondis]|uniref:hypothetical protein n=1 Tax=Cerasicoccus frondis TaxID=490090 RepID=UPI0028529484|nr:hypothetical protein [Cerasicoccus frondis]
MNAAEIIDQFKHLPEDQQARVIEFFRHLNTEEVSLATDSETARIGEQVFAEHPELFRKLSQ